MAFPENLSGQTLYRFVGGRRRINAQRQHRAIDRRYRLMFTWRKHPTWRKADLARHLGVSRSTITRDVQWLKRYKYGLVCPVCGQQRPGLNLGELAEMFSECARMWDEGLKTELEQSSI